MVENSSAKRTIRFFFFFKFVSDFNFSDLISNVGCANISETKLEIVTTLTQERAQSL